jgi:hypothetical protein
MKCISSIPPIASNIFSYVGVLFPIVLRVIHGEFSRLPVNSVKIGSRIKTKKPAITNDVVNDPRIKHPDWARRENLKSFAGSLSSGNHHL